ncbi:unnamed protein product [Rotaria sordida]|uniref:Uncharacterized protein n=1 Tax=Rotaria sordida TaxID=392033 RepID=A0A815GMK1_9BILA|nr:unnamed protein product [Rotaria sordida]
MVSINSELNDFGEREKNSHELYWHDLDKTKFLSLLSASSLVLRTCFHPLAVIKTRLQTDERPVKSTLEMMKKISIDEGIRRGFYRGYSVAILALVFEPVFMGTLEVTRTFLNNNQPKYISSSQWDTITSSLSAGTAALVQQTFIVLLVEQEKLLAKEQFSIVIKLNQQPPQKQQMTNDHGNENIFRYNSVK